MFGMAFGGLKILKTVSAETPEVKIFVFLFTSWKSQSQITTLENLYP